MTVRCDELTTRGDLCSRKATITKPDRITDEPRYYCTQHGRYRLRQRGGRLMTKSEQKS